MSEVRRGSPTQDGEYEVLRNDGCALVVQKSGGLYRYLSGHTAILNDAEIKAHRKHEPLVVPELKELHRSKMVPCVVRVTRSGDTALDGVYYAVRREDGSYLIHCQWQLRVDLE